MASTLDPRFLGTWRLVGVDREEVATGKKLDEDLKQTGYISYTPDGRMMVIISHVHPDGIHALVVRGLERVVVVSRSGSAGEAGVESELGDVAVDLADHARDRTRAEIVGFVELLDPAEDFVAREAVVFERSELFAVFADQFDARQNSAGPSHVLTMSIGQDGDKHAHIVEVQATAEKSAFDDAQLAQLLGLARQGIGDLVTLQRSFEA